MSKPWRQAAAATTGAIAVATVLAWLWTPDTPSAPAIALADVMRAEQLERAEDFRGPQRILAVLAMVVQLLVLAAVVTRPPRWMRAQRRPLLVGAASMAALSVLVTLSVLPLRVIARERAIDVGLVTQSSWAWMTDVAITAATGAAIAAVGGVLGMLALRRWPRGWWVAATVVIVGYAVAHVTLAPLVLDPLTSTTTHVQGPLRGEILTLADQAGVNVGEVQTVDASQRTTAANAYVGGLGPTKRVVLYDTLVRDFSPREVRSVVAHELAHVSNADLRDGLLFVALIAPLGMLAASRLTRVFARWPSGPATPAVLPGLVLAVVLVATPLSMIGNAVSRGVEARADTEAIALSRDPQAFVDLQQRLSITNVSDPDPPRWAVWLLGTHPTLRERLAAGVAAGGRLAPAD